MEKFSIVSEPILILKGIKTLLQHPYLHANKEASEPILILKGIKTKDVPPEKQEEILYTLNPSLS